MRKGVRNMVRLLMFIHGLVGMGAIAGGFAAMTHPQEPLGVSVESLQHSPFSDFFIPGLILFAVLGLGNLLSAWTILRKSKFHGCISSIFSWALVIWIIVQCMMIQSVHFLHILFFIIGWVEVVLSTVHMVKERLFPMDIVFAIYKNLQNVIAK